MHPIICSIIHKSPLVHIFDAGLVPTASFVIPGIISTMETLVQPALVNVSTTNEGVRLLAWTRENDHRKDGINNKAK